MSELKRRIDNITGAELVVKCLEAHEVEYVFGIPGAKVDAVFNALLDSNIKLILCRHEQNAAFMAAAYGRLTQKPGVVLVTSGPGVANLATGLLTATTEGDPVVAIGGNVARNMRHKSSHQKADNSKLMNAVTKYSVEVMSCDSISEIIASAFKQALTPRAGAAFISLPQDLLTELTNASPIIFNQKCKQMSCCLSLIEKAAEMIARAKRPILFLGEEASYPENTAAIRALLTQTPIPTVSTYQAAGVISRALFECFTGRVGLFRNQPGDKLIDEADLVLTIGFNPIEYDPEIWNPKANKLIIHLDEMTPEIHFAYQPTFEILGSIADNIQQLQNSLKKHHVMGNVTYSQMYHDELNQQIALGKTKTGFPIHPLRFIYELRQAIGDETIITCDIGSVYMWMARYFLSYEPHHLLFSNGQQTLGVGLPWAMAAKLAYPHKQVISISGDGGFLFSAQELETAVRENLHFVHFVWRDGAYNMVLEQEMMKYHQRSGVDIGKVDLVHYAKAFGARGFELTSARDIVPLLKEAETIKGPVLIDVPIDYSDNHLLFQAILPNDNF